MFRHCGWSTGSYVPVLVLCCFCNLWDPRWELGQAYFWIHSMSWPLKASFCFSTITLISARFLHYSYNEHFIKHTYGVIFLDIFKEITSRWNRHWKSGARRSRQRFVGRVPLLAFLSCESICFRARVLREPCDLVHWCISLQPESSFLIKSCCNQHQGLKTSGKQVLQDM